MKTYGILDDRRNILFFNISICDIYNLGKLIKYYVLLKISGFAIISI